MRVDECGQHLIGQLVSVGEIDDLDRAAVDRVAEQEELEVVVVGVGVHPGFRQVHWREGLDVNEEFTHARQLLENNGCWEDATPQKWAWCPPSMGEGLVVVVSAVLFELGLGVSHELVDAFAILADSPPFGNHIGDLYDDETEDSANEQCHESGGVC